MCNWGYKLKLQVRDNDWNKNQKEGEILFKLSVNFNDCEDLI